MIRYPLIRSARWHRHKPCVKIDTLRLQPMFSAKNADRTANSFRLRCVSSLHLYWTGRTISASSQYALQCFYFQLAHSTRPSTWGCRVEAAWRRAGSRLHPLESHLNHPKSVVDIVDVEVSVSSVAAPYFIPSTLSAIIFSCIVYHDMNAKNTIVIFLRQDFYNPSISSTARARNFESLKFDNIVWKSFYSNFRMSINDTWDRNVIQMPTISQHNLSSYNHSSSALWANIEPVITSLLV